MESHAGVVGKGISEAEESSIIRRETKHKREQRPNMSYKGEVRIECCFF